MNIEQNILNSERDSCYNYHADVCWVDPRSA